MKSANSMKKEKRFIGYEGDKKSELDVRSVLLALAVVILLAWTTNIHMEEHSGFPVGIVISLILCIYVVCILGYTYGTILIDTDGIHYRNAFFAKKVLYWKDIGKVYKTKASIGRGVAIYVICCTVGDKKQKKGGEFDFAIFKEKSYFMMGYTEERMKEICGRCYSHGD